METTQVALFLCTALYSITHLFNSVVYWRASVTNLVDRLEGTVDPLEKLNKLPLAKRLMKWYNDNFSFRTAGKYSFVLIVGAEVTEFLVQMLRANELAAFLDWTDQKLYLTLIFTNFLVFGLCFLTPERYVPLERGGGCGSEGGGCGSEGRGVAERKGATGARQCSPRGIGFAKPSALRGSERGCGAGARVGELRERWGAPLERGGAAGAREVQFTWGWFR
jgi:hypothetical protein